MKRLEDRILKDGKVLPGDIIKVDGFLNHRVDPAFMRELAQEFARHFDLSDVATVCALEFGIPMVFAKKAKSDNIEGGLYKSEIVSYTYKKNVTLILSKEWLKSTDKVLIIDDFMARGMAVHGLIDIVKQAGAELRGIGIAVEKGFQGGGDALREQGIDVYSLAIIDSTENGTIQFRKQ